MKKVTPELLQGELQVNAGVFSKKKNVSVVFCGDMAGTDGKNIVLPVLPQEHEMSDVAVQVARGYVNHEAGHIQHSDFDAINKMKEQCKRDGNKSLPHLHNALEDIWLEKRVNAEYEGAMDTIAHTARAVNQAFLDGYHAWSENDKVKHMTEEGVGAVALTWQGRLGYGDDTLCQDCLDTLPDDVRDKLPARIAALDHCQNTQDVIDLARAIDLQIKEDAEEERERKRKAKGSDDGECDDAEAGDAEADGQGQDDGDDGASGSGDASREAEEYKTEPEQSSGDGDGGGFGKGTPSEPKPEPEPEPVVEQYDPSMAVGLKSMLAGENSTVEAGGKWKPFTEKYDTVYEPTSRKMRGRPDVYKQIVASMSGKLNAMQRKLEAGLAAQLDVDWETEQLQGRLDTRRLVSAYNCKPNVYRTREPAPDMDTAVTMLVDMSGSMGGQPIKLAREVCVALLETCERLGASTEVVGFTEDWADHTDAEQEALSRNHRDYSRTGALLHYVFKPFSARLADCRGTFATMLKHRMGGNADGDSLDFARKRLRVRHEKRKIMMVLADGWRACSGYGDDCQNLRDAVERCMFDEIDCIGIGIASDEVVKLYPNDSCCENLADLPNGVCAEIGKLLVGDRYTASNADLLKASRDVRAA